MMATKVVEEKVARMREKLGDMTDLSDLSECHAMMAVMLERAEESRDVALVAKEQATELARAVLTESDNATSMARAVLGGERGCNVLEAAERMSKEAARLSKVDDDELVEEVVEVVMTVPGMSVNGAAVEELLRRFKKTMKEGKDGRQGLPCDSEGD